jgi:hypothetical protein
MRRLLLFFFSLIFVEFLVAPFGGRVFDHLFPIGQEPAMFDFYQTGYLTVAALGIGLGAMVAHYWPAVFGWQKDAAERALSLKNDILMLRGILGHLNNSIQTEDGLPPFSEIEYVSHMVTAIELSLQKRKFEIPNLDFEVDPIGFLERYDAYFQRVGPLIATGHLKEARAAASAYVETLHPDFMRPNRLKARQEKRRAKLPSA